MREIKFRAWDDGAKAWLLGYDLPNLGGFSLIGESVLLGDWAAIIDQYIFERGGRKQEDLKVMQHTGLTDKTGRELYEGDICAGNWPYAKRCVVRWAPRRGAFMFSGVAGEGLGAGGGAAYDREGYKLSSAVVEVIGNIYENPELLAA